MFKFQNSNQMNIREIHFIPTHFNIHFELQKFNPTGIQTHQENNQNLFTLLTFKKFGEILECYTLPPLKGISSLRFEKARKKG